MKINVTNERGEVVASRACTVVPVIEGGNLIGMDVRCQPVALPDLNEYAVTVEICDENEVDCDLRH